MYRLYTDKSEDFKCKIDVEGANLNETQARLVLESKEVNLLFEGKVSANGDCIIPIKKLKNLLQEGQKGKMKLEVIAEDTFFSPWEDNFEVDTNKKVTVEVNQPQKPSKPITENRIKVQVSKPEPKKLTIGEHIGVVSETLKGKGVTLGNIKNYKTYTNKIINEYVKSSGIEDKKTFIKEILKKL